MWQQQGDTIKDELFINVRKLAALDIVFHGPKLILAEFGFGVIFCAALGLFGLFSDHFHSPFVTMMGCFFLLVALNYVPPLLYAITIIKGKSVQEEVAFELAHKDKYIRKYTLQSFLLVVPLVVPILAIYQEWQKHSRS